MKSLSKNKIPLKNTQIITKKINDECISQGDEFNAMDAKVSKDITDGSKNSKKSAFRFGKIKPSFSDSDKSKKGDF